MSEGLNVLRRQVFRRFVNKGLRDSMSNEWIDSLYAIRQEG